ncbi:M13-type metalloendopeptidase [Fructobacillus parabroussonetiae]|uniref:Endopeptidase n=1 Tax=Fructobacillus parabroussonetiae TaxID=2713174 RepID=A0ABS5QUM5_9LACO|nr:M13-type metalloendopeptidase [Fructobacillus parabroussonetiae]MBS9336888.1 endopeptidase [Fructobacillus parabroussonetiae]
MTKTDYRDDFYQAVNGAWIEQATIPADRPVTGGFYDLVEGIEKEERRVLAAIEAGEMKTPADLAEFVKFHQLTKDWDRRAAGEKEAVQEFLKPLLALGSWDDYQKQEAALIQAGYTTILAPTIAPDSKNTSRNELWLASPDLIFPDTTSYQDKEGKEALLANWSEMVQRLLEKLGFEKEGAAWIQQAVNFDQILADRQSSSEELSDSWKNYYPMTLAEASQKVPNVLLTKTLTTLLGQEPDKVIIYDGRFFDQAHEVYVEENFDAVKGWLIIQNLLDIAGFLGDDTRVLAGTFGRFLSGTKEAVKPEKSAFRQARAFFSQAVGKWYGETYFGPKAKQDVEAMVHELIQVYEHRFDQIDWLSDETRQKAKVKLAALAVKVGYPDSLPEDIANRRVDEQATLLENVQRFSREAVAKHFKKWGQAPDKSRWGMSADTVNAYYSPDFNQIVFPAAILQAPFYDLKQSASQNFGGIGTVIAHEITHAFDTNGARYDEQGNLKEWWTKEDFAHFEKKTEAVVQAFDGLDSAGAKVNGHLTVSENVADLGGVSATLTAAKAGEATDIRAFFENFATLWRQKAEPKYLALLATIDVHAPAKLRTNVTVKNFDDFAATFDVQEGDGMYLAPEKRIQIW